MSAQDGKLLSQVLIILRLIMDLQHDVVQLKREKLPAKIFERSGNQFSERNWIVVKTKLGNDLFVLTIPRPYGRLPCVLLLDA